jgi:hypothetical protein
VLGAPKLQVPEAQLQLKVHVPPLGTLFAGHAEADVTQHPFVHC